MSKFKVGDRVVVYASDLSGVRGTVQSVHEDGILAVHLDEYYHEVETNEEFNGVLVHPKQCRKLKPKTKKEDKPFFINKATSPDNTYYFGIEGWTLEEAQEAKKSYDRDTIVQTIQVIKKGNK